jgi:hypothetical protein
MTGELRKPSALAQGQMQIGRMLALGVVHGRWTLEHLDKRSPQAQELEEDRVRSISPADPTMPAALRRPGPVMKYPGAGTMLPHRNLAREWIAANPAEWAEMHSAAAEAVVIPTPISQRRAA